MQSATDIDLGLLPLEVLSEFYFYFFLRSHRFHLLKIFISEDLRALQTSAGTSSAKLGAWNPPTWPLIHTDNFIFKASETLKGKKYWPPKFMSKKEMWTCTLSSCCCIPLSDDYAYSVTESNCCSLCYIV